MTATQTAPFGLPVSILNALRQLGAWVAKGFLALAIIFMAGIIAVATAFAGLALALVAVIMRLSGNRTDQGPVNVHEDTNGETVTLEARKTPHGWTVE